MKSVPRVCRVENCGRIHYALDLCSPHYQRRRKGLPVEAGTISPRDGKQGCLVPDCEEKHSEQGYCSLHASRLRRGADLTTDTKYGRTGCNTEGCDRKHHCKGFCRRCYSYLDKYNLDPVQVANLKNHKCDICERDLDTVFVDHDHACCPGEGSCGACVRGFLCQGCNLGLGAFKDREASLERAVEYLRSYARKSDTRTGMLYLVAT